MATHLLKCYMAGLIPCAAISALFYFVDANTVWLIVLSALIPMLLGMAIMGPPRDWQ